MRALLTGVVVMVATAFVANSAEFVGTFKMNPRLKTNSPSYWCDNGIKIEVGNSFGRTFVAEGHYDLVILKSGTKDDVWVNVEPGAVLATTDRKGISHIILCPAVTPPEDPGCPGDQDCDGVPDDRDLCPDTPAEPPSTEGQWFINPNGCWEEAV